MPHGTSKDWDLFNTEERDCRESLKDVPPQWDTERHEPLGTFPNNYEVTRAYVLALNHRGRRDHQPEVLAELRDRFKSSIEAVNLCWQCKLPLRTTKASISNSIYADIRPHFDIRP